MAETDWKNDSWKTSDGIEVTRWLGNSEIIQISQVDDKRWLTTIDAYAHQGKETKVKYFKTKSQAIAYAKSYIRTH